MGALAALSPKHSTALVAASIILLAWVVATIGYRIFFHPLARFPGPFLGRFTSILPYYAVFRDRRTLMQYELLQRYGSPVRVGTDELVFADIQSWNDIYGQSSNPCTKDPTVYNMFTVTGAVNVANAVHRTQHARLRRLLSHGFSTNGLLPAEQLIAEKVDYFVENFILAAPENQPLETYRKTHELFLDIVSHLSFGKSFDCLRGDSPTAFQDVEAFANVIPAISFFPFLRFLPIPAIQRDLRALDRLKNFSQTHVTRFADDLKAKGVIDGPKTFLTNLVLAEDDESSSTLTMDELVEHAIIFIVAGSGTTSIATTYILWEVGRRPNVRAKLTQEIRHAFPDKSIMPTWETVSRLPYLGCVIEEALRLYGPLSSAGPRISPGRLLGGYPVRRGTVVSTCPYATARDRRIFPQPNSFKPERWLDATAEMRAMSRPFSYGPRNCIGKHLAEMGIFLTISRICQVADITTSTLTTDEMMAPKDKGTIEPAGGRLYLDIKPVNVST